MVEPLLQVITRKLEAIALAQPDEACQSINFPESQLELLDWIRVPRFCSGSTATAGEYEHASVYEFSQLLGLTLYVSGRNSNVN